MAAHQVALQLLQVFRANAHIGQFAETGVDPVGRFIAGDDALDHRLRRCDSRPGGRRNGCIHRARGYRADLIERKWLPIQFQDAWAKTRCHADHRMRLRRSEPVQRLPILPSLASYEDSETEPPGGVSNETI